MLAYTMPFWVVLFAWILLGDRPTQRHLWAFGLAALGWVAIIPPWEGLGSMTGSLLALAGGACWGVGTVMVKMLFQSYTHNCLTLTTWAMTLCPRVSSPVPLAFPTPILISES